MSTTSPTDATPADASATKPAPRRRPTKGNQRPRYLKVPKYSESAGDEAIELAAQAGLNLDDWQKFVLRNSLVENEQGNWAATEVGLIVPRQNGKGSVLEARELAGLFLFDEQLIIHSAQLFSTAAEGFRRLVTLVESNNELKQKVRRIVYSHGSEGIELKSGSRIKFMARSRSSMRGFSADVLILDEAYDLAEAAMEAMIPTMAARPMAQVWYTSSAPLADSVVLKRICARGRSAEDTGGLAYFEWAAADDCNPSDPEAWADANPALGYRLTTKFMDREYEALSTEGFKRERLGLYNDAVRERLFPKWSELIDAESKITSRLVFGIDIAPDRGRAAISVAGKRPDEIPHIESVDSRPGAHWIVGRVDELLEKWGDLTIVIDDKASAGSLITDLENMYGVTLIRPTSREIAAGCSRLFDACESDNVRHLGQSVLDDAVDAAVKRYVGDAWMLDRRKPDADISPLVSAALAYWAVTEGHADFDISSQVF